MCHLYQGYSPQLSCLRHINAKSVSGWQFLFFSFSLVIYTGQFLSDSVVHHRNKTDFLNRNLSQEHKFVFNCMVYLSNYDNFCNQK